MNERLQVTLHKTMGDGTQYGYAKAPGTTNGFIMVQRKAGELEWHQCYGKAWYARWTSVANEIDAMPEPGERDEREK